MTLLAPDQVERPASGEAIATLGRIEVVGHDGSAAAAAVLAHAAERAGPEGYLIVVHALAPGDADTGMGYPGAVRRVLRSIEDALSEGVTHEARIVAEPAAKALLDAARRNDADEIVLGASIRPAAKDGVGRVSGSVLKHSDRPVTIVPR